MNPSAKKQFRLLFDTVEIFVIFLAFALVSLNSLIRFRQFPEVDNYSDNEGNYIFAALLVILMIVYLLWKNYLLAAYVTAWKQKKLLVAFLIYAGLSILWTVYVPAT